ncbi:MAG TPA: GNAT family N-acetyltransferase [Syntrophobacter fumaroxidans]|nr:GNAT family N-acetyltransferase [Syntrophobacter fumaroxidans]
MRSTRGKHRIELSDIVFRADPRSGDPAEVGRLARSTGFFSLEEVAVAVELIETRLEKGGDSGYHFIFAERSGQMVGYACFGPVPCTLAGYDLYWIVVLDEFRGKGLGKRLLARTERVIAAAGGTRVYVETSCRGQYEPTRAFYERCGYRLEAVLKDYYAPGEDKAIYRKVLVGENTPERAGECERNGTQGSGDLGTAP